MLGIKAGLALLAVLSGAVSLEAQKFGAWQSPVNVGTPVNGPYMEFLPAISKDGLSLYFTVGQPTGCVAVGCDLDIVVAKRSALDAPWQAPVRLPINTSSLETTPYPTIDGHFLLFASRRTGGYGGNDLYIVKRKDKRVDSGPEEGGWETPVNLGPGVNTSAGEAGPALFEDENGVLTLFFSSFRLGTLDIFMSTLQADGTFAPAVPVTELNTASNEQHPTISRDGLEIYFSSNRPGSIPNPDNGWSGPPGQLSEDIWMATRVSTTSLWSAPVPVAVLNTAYHEGRPSLSFDGASLYFFAPHRTVEAGYQDCILYGRCNVSRYHDLWMTTREKLNQIED